MCLIVTTPPPAPAIVASRATSLRNSPMSLRSLSAIPLLLSALPLSAADDPLNALPAETGVLLRLSPPTELSDKAKAFLNKAAPQYAGLADQLGPGLGSLVANPTLA